MTKYRICVPVTSYMVFDVEKPEGLNVKELLKLVTNDDVKEAEMIPNKYIHLDVYEACFRGEYNCIFDEYGNAVEETPE